MVNINLTTIKDESKSEEAFDKGILMAIGIVIILGIVYFGFYIYGKMIESDSKKIKEEYASREAQIKSGKYGQVIDFQNRLNIASKLIDESNFSIDAMNEVEKKMVAGTKLDSYSFKAEGNIVTVSCEGRDFNDLAKQLNNFKGDFFSDVTTGKSEITQKGKPKMPMTLSINPLAKMKSLAK